MAWGLSESEEEKRFALIKPAPWITDPAAAEAASRAQALDPVLEQELEEDLAFWEHEYGSSDSLRRATIVACLSRIACDVDRHDDARMDADYVLDCALDCTSDPPPAFRKLVEEVRAFVDDARDASVPVEILALDTLLAFFTERSLRDRDEDMYVAVVGMALELVDAASRRGVRFAKDAWDVAQDLVDRIRYAATYRPDGRFAVASFVRDRMRLRLDDAARVVGRATYTPRYVRRLRASGRVREDEMVTEDVVRAAREEGNRRQQHRVPAGRVNNKSAGDILRARQDAGELDASLGLEQRTVDQRIREFEERRGAPYPRVGRSKSIPLADLPELIEFIESRRRG